MAFISNRPIKFTILYFLLIVTPFSYSTPPVCQGFLALINRPTIAESACTVPDKHLVTELGYQYETLPLKNNLQNYPEAQLRLGLPANNEISVYLPNYVDQSPLSRKGLSPTIASFKHMINYGKNWAFSLSGLISPPSGSGVYGNQGWDGTINGVVSYNLTKNLSFTALLGISSLTLSKFAVGKKRYTSINPDGYLTLSLLDNLQLFGEVYGQSKTSPTTGSGFDYGIGLIYLLMPNLTLDIEMAERIHGLLGGYKRYVGAGLAIKF